MTEHYHDNTRQWIAAVHAEVILFAASHQPRVRLTIPPQRVFWCIQATCEAERRTNDKQDPTYAPFKRKRLFEPGGRLSHSHLYRHRRLHHKVRMSPTPSPYIRGNAIQKTPSRHETRVSHRPAQHSRSKDSSKGVLPAVGVSITRLLLPLLDCAPQGTPTGRCNIESGSEGRRENWCSCFSHHRFTRACRGSVTGFERGAEAWYQRAKNQFIRKWRSAD